jgi:hypothetical protein
MLNISNIDFFPRVVQNRRCPRLRFQVLLDKSNFVAGEILYGRLELSCSSHKSVHLGEISVELSGYEGNSKSLFIRCSYIFLMINRTQIQTRSIIGILFILSYRITRRKETFIKSYSW